RQARLVVVDERHDVAARDVAMVDDGEAGGVEGERAADDLAAWNRRADRPRVEQAGERQVVDVARGAGDFLGAFLPQDVASNGASRPRSHREIISAPEVAARGSTRRRGAFRAAVESGASARDWAAARCR